MMWVCPITGDVNFDHLDKVVPTQGTFYRFLQTDSKIHCKSKIHLQEQNKFLEKDNTKGTLSY